jgi:glycosyltransferase involved in cell wall biosynthesis
VTGSIVPIGDVRALASAVALMLRDEELATLARLARTRVARERFSLERMVTETERVYAEALGVEETAHIE